jgi:hypothetical protein
VQNPLHLNEDSVARPNLMLLRPRADFYAQAHPRPGVVPPQAPPSAAVDLAPLLAAS